MPGSRRLDLPTVQGPDHEERMERTRVREKTRERRVRSADPKTKPRASGGRSFRGAQMCSFVLLIVTRPQTATEDHRVPGGLPGSGRPKEPSAEPTPEPAPCPSPHPRGPLRRGSAGASSHSRTQRQSRTSARTAPVTSTVDGVLAAALTARRA